MPFRTLRRVLAGLSCTALLAAGPVLTAAPAQAAGGSYCSDQPPPQYQRLGSGQKLTSGQRLSAYYTTLTMQEDGNLVLRLRAYGNETNGPHLWYTGTYGNPGAYAHMQPDGNLVVYRQDGTALWASGTWNNPGACAEITPWGDFNVSGQDFHGPLFATQTGICLCSGRPGPPLNILSAGYTMGRGQWLQTSKLWLTLQNDGEFALYRKSDGAQLWKAGTQGQGWWSRVVLQHDGNLVVQAFTGDRSAPVVREVAATGTWGNPGAELQLQEDGNVVLYGPNLRFLWQTRTYGQV